MPRVPAGAWREKGPQTDQGESPGSDGFFKVTALSVSVCVFPSIKWRGNTDPQCGAEGVTESHPWPPAGAWKQFVSLLLFQVI